MLSFHLQEYEAISLSLKSSAYLKSGRQSIGYVEFWAGPEKTVNAIYAKIAVISEVHNKKTASFVDDFVSRRKKIILESSPEGGIPISQISI